MNVNVHRIINMSQDNRMSYSGTSPRFDWSGPVHQGPPGYLTFARWASWSGVQGAATSNVEVGQTTCSVNRSRGGMEGREGSEGQSHKEEEREGGSGMGRGT